MDVPAQILQLFDGHSATSIINFLTNTIFASFKEDNGPKTRAEIKRRFDLCFELLGVMRGDMKWSFQRCTDELPRALRVRLDGGIYEPNKRGMWLPGDGL